MSSTATEFFSFSVLLRIASLPMVMRNVEIGSCTLVFCLAGEHFSVTMTHYNLES
jgi:hypothetical protein